MPKNRILKRKDGRYQYQTTNSSGRRCTITSKKGETRAAFYIRCEELDAHEMMDTPADLVFFDDLFNAWVRDYVEVGLSKGYQKDCEYTYQRYIKSRFARKRLQDIKRKDVYHLLAYYDKKGLSGKTLAHIRLCFSAPYSWAINTMGLDLISPTDGLIYRKIGPEKPKRNRIISDEDMERFMKAAWDSKYFNYFSLLQLTGVRPSEGLGLQIKDIKPDHLEIRRAITRHGLSHLKTETAARDLPMTDPLKEVLLDQKNKMLFATPEGWLFPAGGGAPSMNAANNALKRAVAQTAVYERGGHNGMKKLGMIAPPVQLSLYDFRHTYATRLAENKVNPKALQYLMGHKDIETTLHYYVGITHNMLDEAKEIMEELA